mgnify:CR=1 FL=1
MRFPLITTPFKTGPLLFSLCLLFVPTLTPSSISAHPHLFVTTRYILVFEEQGLKGIQVNWEFDEMYSVGTVESFDENKDGELNPAEAQELAKLGTEHLAKFSYFTNVVVDQTPYPLKLIQDMKVTYEQSRLFYSFYIPFPVPINNKDRIIKISPYDPEYFAAMFFTQQKPVLFQNAENFQIQSKIAEDPDTRIYFDMINPIAITLSIRKK